jgi:hypothetical protein
MLSYDEQDGYFYTKSTEILKITDPRHPKHQALVTEPPREATTSSTEGITMTLANTPVFQDIVEDNQPPQLQRDYMPATITLRPFRFANMNLQIDSRSATNNSWLPA